jgi:Uma2 family endonuclease
MSTATRAALCTFADFCAQVKDGEKGDLIDGIIYMASPDNTDANDLFMWLGGLMYDFAQVKDLGRVFGSRVAFQLDETNAPEPDIAFVKKRRLRLVKRGRVDGPPDLAVEIVSPESRERDFEQKRKQYLEAGVREYWIVDELQRKVTLLRLNAKGKYREVRPRNGQLRSQVLPAFWILVDWLWSKPLPVKSEILTRILGDVG